MYAGTNLERDSVVVTGANGFIGSHMIRALVDAGYFVRALSRGAAPHAEPNVEWIRYTGLDDVVSLERACGGALAVVHAAGRAHETNRGASVDPAAFRVNADGTRAVLDAAASAGTQSLVFISSIGAVRSSGNEIVDENTAPAPVSNYSRSKLAAEAIVQSYEAGGMRRFIVRPPMVYGPRMRGNPLLLFKLVARGVPLPVGAIRNLRSTLFVENLAAGVIAILQCTLTGSETFMISDAGDVSTPDLVTQIAEALGVHARILPVHRWLLNMGGELADSISSLVPLPFSSSAAESLVASLRVDSSKLSRLTGFVPPFSRREGLARSAEWYHANGVTLPNG